MMFRNSLLLTAVVSRRPSDARSVGRDMAVAGGGVFMHPATTFSAAPCPLRKSKVHLFDLAHCSTMPVCSCARVQYSFVDGD
jgi:hypothetical protein